MTKRKIAILLPALQAGGAERFVSYLINFLESDFEIHLVLFDDLVEYELPASQILYILDGKSHTSGNVSNTLKLPVLARRLVSYCNKNGVSVVVAFLHRANFVACVAKKVGLKAKVIISERTHAPTYFKKNKVEEKVVGFLISALYPIADYILPNSKGVGEALSNYYGVKNNYRVIKNIIDSPSIEIQKQEPVNDVSFDRFTFITVGNLLEGKNHEMLLNAFRAMNSEGCQLLLIGKGERKDKLEQQALRLGIDDKVVFLGYQGNPFKYISRADCFVFSSDFEGFPNVLIEALACGTPVISTDCKTGPRELLAPETDFMTQITDHLEIAEFGILVPVGDEKLMTAAMCRIRQDADLRSALREKSARRVKDFAGESVVEELKNVILGVL